MKGALTSAFKIYLSTIAISLLARFLFLIVYFDKSAELGLGLVLQTFWHGLTLDISIAGYLTAPVMLVLLFGTWGGWHISKQLWQRILRGYMIFVAVLLAVVVATDAMMYGHWGYKIDATLLPYLTSPRDAAASATWGDSFLWLGVALAMLIPAVKLYTLAVRDFEFSYISLKRRIILTPLMLLLSGLVFLGIRGGVSESVANVSKVYFSSEQFANHAAVNAPFSLFSSMRRVESYDELFPFYKKAELMARFEKMKCNRSGEPTRSILKTKRPNVAIVICESYTDLIMNMESEGREVMPNLKKIAAEGLYFENTYAAGARTDKGVATVLSGFPAQPILSIMKIPAKSRNLPSLASSLGAEGYRSEFYYGGDLNFMDMASYLYATGWQKLVWNRDIESPDEKPRQWGYSDGVTMSRFADEVISLGQSDEPFLATLLTLSSHEPFDVPEDMGFKDRMLNSMAYSDAKMGAMVEQLRSCEVWDDLLLIIVADHTFSYPYDVNYNSPLRHHIPLIFSGGALTHRGVESNFVSQMDIAATLLSQMGLSHEGYLFSRDYFAEEKPASAEYIYYTYNNGFGVSSAEGAVVYDNNMSSIARAESNGDDLEVVDSPQDMSSHEQGLVEYGKTMLQMTHYAIEQL